MPRAPKTDADNPDKEVRFPVVLTVNDRWRLRAVAAILRRPAEDVAGEWVTDRLAAEEKRLGIPRAK